MFFVNELWLNGYRHVGRFVFKLSIDNNALSDLSNQETNDLQYIIFVAYKCFSKSLRLDNNYLIDILDWTF